MDSVEKFEIACDRTAHRARVAFLGAEGAEILLILPIPDSSDPLQGMTNDIYNSAEKALRAALLALIRKSWPEESS